MMMMMTMTMTMMMMIMMMTHDDDDDDHEDADNDDVDVETFRGPDWAQNADRHFVRACAVETHAKISQEPLSTEIYR